MYVNLTILSTYGKYRIFNLINCIKYLHNDYEKELRIHSWLHEIHNGLAT